MDAAAAVSSDCRAACAVVLVAPKGDAGAEEDVRVAQLEEPLEAARLLHGLGSISTTNTIVAMSPGNEAKFRPERLSPRTTPKRNTGF